MTQKISQQVFVSVVATLKQPVYNFVTSSMEISNSSHGCLSKLTTLKAVKILFFHDYMWLSVFLEQPSRVRQSWVPSCKLVTNYYQQLVQNMFQQLGTNSAKTTCLKLENNLLQSVCKLVTTNICVSRIVCFYSQMTSQGWISDYSSFKWYATTRNAWQ